MKKIIKFIILTLCIFLPICSYVNAEDIQNNLEELSYDIINEDLGNKLKLTSSNILLYNLTDNNVIYKKNSTEKISIASLTKMMTALVVIEKVPNLDDTVTVSKDAFYDISEYSTAGFKIGDKITYKDLLYGILLPSGADAAQEAAIAVGKSIDSFVPLMNEEAQKIGLTNTSYSNPVGRDEKDNYSTVEDQIKLLLYALNNPTFYEIYTSKTYTTTNNIELSSTLKTSATRYKLNIDGIIGSKSGYTDAAGLCLSSIAEYNGIKYLLITAGAEYEGGYPNHISDTTKIYNYFINNYGYHNIITKNQKLLTIKIEDGFEKEYTVTSPQDISIYLNNDIDLNDLEYKYSGIETLNSKIKTNDKLGKIEVMYNDNLLYTYDVVLTEEIKYKHTKIVITVSILILIFIILLMLKKKLNSKKRRRKHAKRSKKH